MNFSKYYFLVLQIFIAQSAFSGMGCFKTDEGKIRYIDNQKSIEIKSSYCFDSDLKSISSPKNTFRTKGPFKMKFSDLHDEVGSPGFKICNQLNGTPQLIDFWDGIKWIPTSRCIFKDKSFIDIDTISAKVEFHD